jgi:hypothetical protein
MRGVSRKIRKPIGYSIEVCLLARMPAGNGRQGGKGLGCKFDKSEGDLEAASVKQKKKSQQMACLCDESQAGFNEQKNKLGAKMYFRCKYCRRKGGL